MLKEASRYTLVDRLTVGYVAIIGVIVLVKHGDAVPNWPLYVAGHVLTLGFIVGLIRLHRAFPRNRALDFLRQFYPMLLYGPFYGETAHLNHVIFPGFLDPWFLRFEHRLFGTEPSIAFLNRLPYLAVSEMLAAAYFSYYLMIAGVALALFLRNRRQFAHYLALTAVVFYPCYLCYVLLPVVGPLILFHPPAGYLLPADVRPAVLPLIPAAIQGGPFYRLMALVYVPFEAPGASFPSSHVAVAILTVYFSFRYLRAIRWPHFILLLLLCAATVYGQYHYVSDVAAGALTAALLIPLGNWLYFRFERNALGRLA